MNTQTGHTLIIVSSFNGTKHVDNGITNRLIELITCVFKIKQFVLTLTGNVTCKHYYECITQFNLSIRIDFYLFETVRQFLFNHQD